MRHTHLAAALAVLLLGPGCIVVSGGGGGGGSGTGDLTIYYTFGGSPCDVAGVSDIEISIAGVNTTDADVKHATCAEAPDGLTIHDFVAGSYDVTVSGLSGATVLYRMDTPQRMQVLEGTANDYTVDVPGRFGDLAVYWPDFDGLSCAQAGVDQVRVQLFDASQTPLDDQTFGCGVGGVSWQYLAPGSYTIWLDAENSYGDVLWQSTVDATVQVAASMDYDAAFTEVVGSITLYWTFEGSGVCGFVQDVHVTAYAPDDTVYDDYTYPCTDGGVQYPTAPMGTMQILMDGIDDTGQVIYRSAAANVTVEAGASREYTIDLQGI